MLACGDESSVAVTGRVTSSVTRLQPFNANFLKNIILNNKMEGSLQYLLYIPTIHPYPTRSL